MKLYLDMDGVIADFFGKVEQNYNVDHWKDLEDPSKTIESFKNTNWFYTLNPFLTSADLVAACRRIAGREYGICSSPIGGDEYNSGYWKREWLKQWGFLPEIQNLIFTGNKHRYAVDNLTTKGSLFFEINEYLGKPMTQLLKSFNFNAIELKQDIFKKDRMIKGTKKA